MALDITTLLKDMLGAAKPILKSYWKEAKPYAEKESQSFLSNLAMIEKLKLTGEITKEEADIHVQIQKNSFRTVLVAIKGIGIITAENAINAAIGVIKNTVNSAIGWTLL